ncbi:MAG: group II intron reverse transcriptase/maturase [Leptospiraceae bacterium]|nr:group II intron reverse transcriptase/maturase [Leptospiraceae bacterium]MCP5498864.1 group II intron reverse transcriptase/maturase [Leptospiraceae bacterium]MCP5502588.1 group II intron reverse transcriptase/maturase [Leptospiraceae bacterium]
MEDILTETNLGEALWKVLSNKGAAGIDGVRTEDFHKQLTEEWEGIKTKLLNGKYKPKGVRRVEIPKPNGGTRMLGIPTVMDRFIQQAMLQKLNPIFDPEFSEYSYGFRPRRSAHDAVRQSKKYIEEGYEYVVDLDLEKFFDTVNHDILMYLVSKKVRDKRVLRLIGNYLRAGILENGVITSNEEGTPQGGVISPLLANILLNELDKELESRGHRFCRYADDCNIYVKSRKAGERVKKSITDFLKKKLKLKVNESKSSVDKPMNRKFLGFSFQIRESLEIIISPQSLKRVKDKIRKLTNSLWSISMEERIKSLNKYLNGWLGYYSLSDTEWHIGALDGWLRRRMRLCSLHQWKKSKTRIRELRKLGASEGEARRIGYSRKGNWRLSMTPQIHKVMGIDYWKERGLVNLVEGYNAYRQGW